MRGPFLDISKAFDKVWHEGLNFKLRPYGVEGNLLKLLGNYLTDCQQRVPLIGRTRSWQNIYAGVPNKQTKELRFSNKRDKENYPPLQFNSTNVKIADSQKDLGLILDSKLNFNEHIESKITKCNKIIGLMKKLSLILSRKSLLTIYKSFVRPNLDYVV